MCVCLCLFLPISRSLSPSLSLTLSFHFLFGCILILGILMLRVQIWSTGKYQAPARRLQGWDGQVLYRLRCTRCYLKVQVFLTNTATCTLTVIMTILTLLRTPSTTSSGPPKCYWVICLISQRPSKDRRETRDASSQVGFLVAANNYCINPTSEKPYTHYKNTLYRPYSSLYKPEYQSYRRPV